MSLGVDLNAGAGKRVCRSVSEFDLTAHDRRADVDRPHLVALPVFGVHPYVLTCAVGNDCRELPCSYGHGNKHSLTGGGNRTRAGDGDRRNIFIGIGDHIGSGKAVRDLHMVKLPTADVVEVNIGCDSPDLFDVGRNKVDIVDRAEEYVVKRSIVRNELYRRNAGVCFYVDLADNRSIVALLIADREFNSVNTVREDAVGNGDHSAFDSAGDLYAVDVNARGRFIKSGRVILRHVGDRCAEGDAVVGRCGGRASYKAHRIAHF